MIKHRYETLDAMRGVAAVAVVMLHLGVWIAPIRLPHAYLAVDFFFALSGFVLARAYGTKLDRGLGVRRFMTMRLIRFYPLYILGTAIGVFVMLWPMVRGYWGWSDPRALAGSMLTSLLMLPGPSLPTDLPYLLLPYNPPAWSLFFEVVANLVMVACWRFLKPVTLAVVLLGSAVLLAVQCLAHGGLDGGATWTSIPLGVTRTTFSFTVGLALARVLPVAARRHGPVAWLLLLVLALSFAPGLGVGPWYDLACVFLIMPALLALGASVEPVGGGAFRFLGTISFAIYALHDPLVHAIGFVVPRVLPDQLAHGPWVGLMALPGFVLFAWVADLFYDRRARAWLRRRFDAEPSGAL